MGGFRMASQLLLHRGSSSVSGLFGSIASGIFGSVNGSGGCTLGGVASGLGSVSRARGS